MDLNYLIFPGQKTKISLEQFLLGKVVYIPKLKQIKNDDSQLIISPKSTKPHEFMHKYCYPNLKATKNIMWKRSNSKKSNQLEEISQSTNENSPSNSKRTSFFSQKNPDPSYLGYDPSQYYPIGHIPTLFLQSHTNSSNIIIFFHGNGEDIHKSYPLLNHLRTQMEINIIGVEYPNYGIYKTNLICNEENILKDAQYVLKYVQKILKFEPQNIIIIGRSLGTGPAVHLASKYKVGALVLISAFVSIRGIIQEYAGFLKYMVKERFENIQNIEKVECPVFFLHGKKDKHISYKQSLELQKKCKCKNKIVVPEDMNHVSFNYQDDLTFPLLNFLLQVKYPLGQQRNSPLVVPEGMLGNPDNMSNTV